MHTMDPSSAVELKPESDEAVPIVLSWSAVWGDPTERWKLLGEVRKAPGGKGKITLFQNEILAIADAVKNNAPVEEQEKLRDTLSDMLYGVGIKLEIGDAGSVSVEAAGAPTNDYEGWGARRAPAEFPVPVLAPEEIPTVSSNPVPEAIAEIEKKLADPNKPKVSMQRSMAALGSDERKGSKDAAYATAYKKFYALWANRNNVPTEDLWNAYNELEHAAEPIIKEEESLKAPQVLAVPEEPPKSDMAAIVKEGAKEMAANVAGVPPTEPSVASFTTPPAETPVWGEEPAVAVPSPPSAPEAVSDASTGDVYREPVPVASTLEPLPEVRAPEPEPVASAVPVVEAPAQPEEEGITKEEMDAMDGILKQ